MLSRSQIRRKLNYCDNAFEKVGQFLGEIGSTYEGRKAIEEKTVAALFRFTSTLREMLQKFRSEI